MRPWILCLSGCLCAWTFRFWCAVHFQVLAVSLGFLASCLPGPCFWGSRNCHNCLLSVPVRRTTCAFKPTAHELMDFMPAPPSPVPGLRPFRLRAFAFCFVVVWSWSLLGPKFEVDHHPAGWTFQPHDFAAKTSHLGLFWEGYQRPVFCGPIYVHHCPFVAWFSPLFDSTLGYPGEGPGPSNMTIVSANIGSVMTDVTWKTWSADVVCLQETRVGKNNVRTATKTFQGVGFTPCFGDLLPGLWSGSKSTKTPPGGTLIAGGST